MNKTARFTLSLLLATVIFLGINMVARTAFYRTRLDLTQGHLYTLSPATKKIVSSVKEPLHIRFFFSEAQANGLPVFQAYADRVRGMLKQLADLSGGTITVDFFNPSPFTEEEDLAVSSGLQGIPVDDAGTKFYFGMSVENSTDDRGVMPFFDPAREKFLEYDTVRLMYDVAHPARKKVGLISSLPLGGIGGLQPMPQDEWTVLTQLKQSVNVEVISREATSLPKDMDVLMLVHPYNLSEATLYAIDQYLLKGGKALIFLDSHLQLPIDGERQSDFSALMKGWGIALEPGKVAAEKDAAIQVTQPGMDTRLRAFPNVTWLEMGGSYLSKDSIVTTSLNKLRFIESGYFTRSKDATVAMEPLVTTTPAAMSVNAALLKDGGDPLALYKNYMPGSKPLVLAAQLTGNVKSAFGAEGHGKDYVNASTAPLHVIVVGDSDMLRDEIWVEKQPFGSNVLTVPTADNGAFVLNAIEYLAGDNALITLRSRGTQAREFTALAALKQQAELRFSEQEQQLKEKLRGMEQRMKALQSQEQHGKELFDTSQQKEIHDFREAFMETRKQLRTVQHDLNRDIERLGRRLALLNIMAVPLLVLIFAFILPGFIRNRGRRRLSLPAPQGDL